MPVMGGASTRENKPPAPTGRSVIIAMLYTRITHHSLDVSSSILYVVHASRYSYLPAGSSSDADGYEQACWLVLTTRILSLSLSHDR